MGHLMDPVSRAGLPYPALAHANKPEWECWAYQCRRPIAIVLWWPDPLLGKLGYCVAHAMKIKHDLGGRVLGQIK